MTSDRDMLFYWAYALGSFGAGGSLFFITPRSAVRTRPPLPTFRRHARGKRWRWTEIEMSDFNFSNSISFLLRIRRLFGKRGSWRSSR